MPEPLDPLHSIHLRFAMAPYDKIIITIVECDTGKYHEFIALVFTLDIVHKSRWATILIMKFVCTSPKFSTPEVITAPHRAIK